MKILYHHRISSRDGQYVHIEELTTALHNAGHEVVTVGPRIAGEQTFGGESRFVATLKKSLPKALYELLEFLYSFIDYFHLARALREHRPDIIYERYNLFWLSGVWARRRFSIPLISEVNAPLYDERSRYGGLSLKRLARFTERASWRGADRVITITNVLAERIAREGIARKDIVVTPNAINPSRFSASVDRPTAKRLLGLADFLVIGFVGFAREWHGLDRVIEALSGAGRDDLYFLLVGYGSVCDALKQSARAKGVEDRVHVTGVMPRDKVAEYVQAFDIALQPAVVDYASPLKLFEYMACGAAIVAPDKANIREILTHERDSLLFDPATPSAFTDAVGRLCRDVDLRARLGEAARQTIWERDLTWAHNAETVEGLARKLAASGDVGLLSNRNWRDRNV